MHVMYHRLICQVYVEFQMVKETLHHLTANIRQPTYSATLCSVAPSYIQEPFLPKKILRRLSNYQSTSPFDTVIPI